MKCRSEEAVKRNNELGKVIQCAKNVLISKKVRRDVIAGQFPDDFNKEFGSLGLKTNAVEFLQALAMFLTKNSYCTTAIDEFFRPTFSKTIADDHIPEPLKLLAELVVQKEELEQIIAQENEKAEI